MEYISSPGLFRRLRSFGQLIKFSHTIFALPFALAMLLIVHRSRPVTLDELVWILIALVTARTAAMTFNRIVDHDLDALNPRTVSREIPSGVISPAFAWICLAAASAAFFLASYKLGPHCIVLAPAVLGILLFYSWTKRFTKYSHLVLGLALSLAPGGVWYALTAEVKLLPVILMSAVLFWVAGFDVLYSLQDDEFDRDHGVFSFPAVFGREKALFLARVLHIIAATLLFAFDNAAGLGPAAYLGTAIFTALLISQHTLVTPNDLSKLDAAFFTTNGFASVIYLVSVFFDGMS